MGYVLKGRCRECNILRTVVVDTSDRTALERFLKNMRTYHCPGGHLVPRESFLASYVWDFDHVQPFNGERAELGAASKTPS